MAYPIQLFDAYTDDGKFLAKEFFYALDKTLTETFGLIQQTEDTKKFAKLAEAPEFLKKIAHKSLKDILKQDKQIKALIESKDTFSPWKATIGSYGRKVSTMIKRDPTVLYRLVINVGDVEVYQLDSEMFKEPAVLPNTYALLCSPTMVASTDLKVQADPHRKNLSKDILSMVPRIRPRNYMRCTIVLDLPLELPDLPVVQTTSIDSKTLDILSNNETKEPEGPKGEEGQQGCSGGCSHDH